MNGDSLAVNGNRIDGGSDDDQLLVSQNDRAFGGSGNDVILSGEGENRLYGGLGNDGFFVANNDRVFGGNGIDRIFMETGGNNRLTGEITTDNVRLRYSPPNRQACWVTLLSTPPTSTSDWLRYSPPNRQACWVTLLSTQPTSTSDWLRYSPPNRHLHLIGFN